MAYTLHSSTNTALNCCYTLQIDTESQSDLSIFNNFLYYTLQSFQLFLWNNTNVVQSFGCCISRVHFLWDFHFLHSVAMIYKKQIIVKEKN